MDRFLEQLPLLLRIDRGRELQLLMERASRGSPAPVVAYG